MVLYLVEVRGTWGTFLECFLSQNLGLLYQVLVNGLVKAKKTLNVQGSQ